MSTGGSGKNLRTTKKQINGQLDKPRNRQLDGGSFKGASIRGSNKNSVFLTRHNSVKIKCVVFMQNKKIFKNIQRQVAETSLSKIWYII